MGKNVDVSKTPQEMIYFLSTLYSFCVTPFLFSFSLNVLVINESLGPCVLQILNHMHPFSNTASKQPSLRPRANMASKGKHKLFSLYVKCCVLLNLTSSH